jgi:hypothetical protein
MAMPPMWLRLGWHGGARAAGGDGAPVWCRVALMARRRAAVAKLVPAGRLRPSADK